MRRGAEQLLVVAAEVRGVTVADAVAGARRVQLFAEHQAARLLEPDLLLELQRAHRGDGLEMVVEARDAHSALTREFLDPQRLVVMVAQVANRP